MDKKETILQVRDLHVHFPVKRGIIIKRTVAEVKAVDGISLDVRDGETVGLVGESGCGKTFLCDMYAGLVNYFTVTLEGVL